MRFSFNYRTFEILKILIFRYSRNYQNHEIFNKNYIFYNFRNLQAIFATFVF